ncbi:hypothetical protein NP233_g12185 [Leucocoprinus birnbaumii]|uniref:Uncharacterized protein n=1 Tax=Leucocoprinus birnbaumii TaxID=56174 RepID=A0AAD5VIU4_9AGAR|nr:hypothetical protein NP233_g12185 [Leucocoprinus birnbaumii]
MKQAGVSDPSKCYFVDDNRGNIDGAIAQGWRKCVHFCEKGLEAMEGGIMKQIGDEPLDPEKTNDNPLEMEYHPRYAQPFTLAEAVGLDVSVITDEIARLHNSLKHLQETQKMLREYQSAEAPGTVDPEIRKALDENEVVIGSQTERISILKMALAEKGVVDSSHYDIPDPTSAHTTENSASHGNTRIGEHEEGENEDEGLHL